MASLNPPTDPVPVDLSIEERIAAAVTRYGADDVVARSVALLGGANAGEDFLLYVGGRHAVGIVAGAPPLYWPELWGARALLYVWDESAASAIVAGLSNQAWRVREMSARVSQVRALPVATQVAVLVEDDVSRVRAAAVRALSAIGTTEHVELISSLLRDSDKETRRAAQESRDALVARLG